MWMCVMEKYVAEMLLCKNAITLNSAWMALNALVLAVHLFYPLCMYPTIRVFSGEVGFIFYLLLRTLLKDHKWKLLEEKLRIKVIESEVIQEPTIKHTPFCDLIFQSEKKKSLYSMKTSFFFLLDALKSILLSFLAHLNLFQLNM